MKDFLKFTFASCLGVILAGFLMFFLVMMIGMGLASSGSSTKMVSNSVLKLDFSQPIPERTNNINSTYFAFSSDDVYGLYDIITLIRKAKKDDRIKGIYIDPISSSLGLAGSKELASAIMDFKSDGKFVASHSNYYTQNAYYLASTADHVSVNPIGTVDFRGFAAYVPFYKELMDKMGFKMNIFYAGNFKSATEPFRRTEMSPENKLQTKEFLSASYADFIDEIAEYRDGLGAEELKEIAYQFKVSDAQDALDLGMVDLVGFQDEVEDWMNEKMDRKKGKKINYIKVDEYGKSKGTSKKGSGEDRIAIVYAEGTIITGEEQYGSITNGQYVDIFQKLRDRDNIKAIVLRVNSPGGDILSAEKIYREIKMTKEAGIPIVVSMGDYAASGGYYISVPADSIFAEETTLTGSIGVFSMIPNFSEMLNNKLGVSFDTVRTGPYSAGFTPFLDWDQRENEFMQKRTDKYYELFLERVAEGRDMTKEEVHKIAQGRIWDGEKAKEIGLIDAIGDLDSAIKSAADLAGLEKYKLTEYPRLKNPTEKLMETLTNPQSEVTSGIIDKAVKDNLESLYPLIEFGKSKEPQARLPVFLNIK